jgi:general secretion pathway protein D
MRSQRPIGKAQALVLVLELLILTSLAGIFAPAAQAQESARTLSFNFRNARISEVVEYLSRQTGWTFIFDKHKDVQGKIGSRITAVSADPVPVSRALDFLNTALAPHKLSTVRIKDVVIVLTVSEAKKRTFEIYVGSDPDKIPFGDNIVTQIIPLKHSNVADIKKELEDLVSDDGKLLLNTRSNSLILIDTATNVRKFCTIINALDTQVTQEVLIKPFTLQNADATTVAKVINEIFEEDPSSTSSRRTSQRGGIGRFISRIMGGSRTSAQSQKLQPMQKVKVSVDERTNTIIVRAAKEYMTQITQLVAELDLRPVEIVTTMVYHLKNSDVENVSTILTNLLQDQNKRSSTSGNTQRTNPFSFMFGNRSSGGGSRGGFTRSRANEGGYDEILGDVRVEADKDNNSLVIASNPKNFPVIKRLIDELDRVRAQVLIKVFIAEVTLDNETELGMEWSWNDSLHVGSDDGSWNSNTDFGLTGGANAMGFRYQLISENIDVFIRAMKRKGRLKVLSAPRILVLDNQEAKINVGRQVPRITNTRVTDEGNVINSIQYEDVGISLQVTPHINPDGLVKMEIVPEVSEMAPQSEGVQISEGAVAPVFVTSSAQTTVAVRDSHTVIIGGLIRSRIAISRYSIPFLGDIPIIGTLFQSQNIEETKTELMIFLTPIVVRNAESLRRLSERETQALHLLDRLFLDRIINDGIPMDRVRKKQIAERLE